MSVIKAQRTRVLDGLPNPRSLRVVCIVQVIVCELHDGQLLLRLVVGHVRDATDHVLVKQRNIQSDDGADRGNLHLTGLQYDVPLM